MTDQDLLDRMARSTGWTDELRTDPAPDIARGRSRLLRRRIGLAAASASVAAVILVAAVAIPGRLAGGSGEPAVATETGHPSDTSGLAPDDPVATAAWRNLEALAGRVDPGRTHVPRGLPGWKHQATLSALGDIVLLDAYVPWRQGGGTGGARVSIVDRSLVDSGVLTRPDTRSDRCDRSPYGSMPPEMTYTSCSFTTVNGKRVLVGTTSAAPRAFYASYVRPDGDSVVAEIDGSPMIELLSGDAADRRPAVLAPSVQVAALIAAVTDEGLTMPR